ncbi:MAG: 30S ribosomal protein S19 [Candidatus Lokiarchaeota archaeon]|nr:30S ribosomal protein S19 [Candidatus Lokiarchaeota archaeon]
MPKKFTYRGYTVKELQTMSMDEFIKIIPARQRRSLLRGLPNRQKKFLEKLRRARRALKKGKKIIIRTHNRDSIITPEMIGVTIAVHNGIEFLEFTVSPDHIGHYLGEFAPTRKKVMHGNPGIGATKSSQYVPLK